MTDMKFMQKITTVVNASLMGFVFFAIFFFYHYGITYMVYHSIPTLACYVVFFVMIRKGMLYQYACAVYTVITIYMMAGNICLGYSAGFHLYCISLIPLSFYMVYLAGQLNLKSVNPLWTSLSLICVALGSTVYAVLKGPVYEVGTAVLCACMVVNSVAVFAFLIGYAGFMLMLITDSEHKLTEMANTDNLTGLCNRHYMAARLGDRQGEAPSGRWLAMADIDDFKNINDTYGHNCGDHVLIEIAKAMREVCEGCTVCRWGGEEFLIVPDSEDAKPVLLEQLRQRVQNMPVSYQGNDFPVTITIGAAACRPGEAIDGWIRRADDKLYEGKAGGKNTVVY